MNSNKLCIIGANETAERILLFCEKYNLFNVIGFAVDKAYIKSKYFHNRPVWPIEELEQHIDKNNCYIYIALFWNHLNGDRRRLYERMEKAQWSFANIISPLASIRGKGNIGTNCWIMDYVVIQEGVQIGNNVIVADFVFIGNGAQIANHCFLAARSSVMGSANIGEQTFIGIGATIFDVVKVGRKCLVGACTIQKYDLPDFSVVKVNTINNSIKQYAEDEIESKWVAKHPKRVNKNRNNG